MRLCHSHVFLGCVWVKVMRGRFAKNRKNLSLPIHVQLPPEMALITSAACLSAGFPLIYLAHCIHQQPKIGQKLAVECEICL